MQYRNDKHGNKLSVLGYGCMRFTRKGNGIDVDKAEKELMAAYEAGVNYFDTAYIYPGSEAALGEILERNGIRDKVNIATKIPQFMIRNREALDKYFDEQLARMKTTYIDYYLMHHVTDVAMWEKLKAIGVLDWIRGKKESGAIKNIGFSYHGNTENFLKVLGDYDWEFCQVQYNYLDEVSQAGVKGVRAAAERGIPESGRGWFPAEWGLRWLYDQPEVTVVLSGMNSVEMVKENCRTASEALAGHLTEEDRAVLEEVKKNIREKEKVGCTGCRYCMPCPKGVDIPGIFRCYNAMYTESKSQGRFQFAQTVGLTKKPAFATQCVQCGKCEQHCPQSIPIRQKLKEADKALRPLPYKIGIDFARWFMFRGQK